MKICFFANAHNVHVQRLSSDLARRGHVVQVVCHKPVEIPGVAVERFRVPGPGFLNPHRFHRRWANSLREFLRRFDVVVHFFLHDWGFNPEIIQSGCYIAAPSGSDIVPPPGEEPPTPTLVENRIALLRHASCVGTYGPSFGRIVADFAGLDVAEIQKLPIGVDLERFRPAARPRVSSGRHREGTGLRVGFFKGFRAVYGPTVLMEAIPLVLQRDPHVEFELVGDGPQLALCRAMAAKQRVEGSLTWIPRQPHRNIAHLLSRWDVTVMPSVHESFGVAALEASAMQVPVIATQVTGFADTVRNGETGLLVPPESPEALAQAVTTLLRDGPRRARMGEVGRTWVQRHHEWHDALDQWMNTFHRALNQACVMV